MEWLNLTCTMYRTAALPETLFDGILGEYALMEDVALSLKVRRKLELAACRTAIIYHDSRSQDYKSNAFRRQMMEVRNRAHIGGEIAPAEAQQGVVARVEFRSS